jgi:hypothetical protein
VATTAASNGTYRSSDRRLTGVLHSRLPIREFGGKGLTVTPLVTHRFQCAGRVDGQEGPMTSLPDETRNWFLEETQNAPGMEVGQPLVRLCWVIVCG